VVAAFGRKGLLQAARRGLAYLASPLEPLDVLEANYARWREACAVPPDPRAPATPVMRSVFVARDDAEAARVREALGRELAGRVGSRAPTALRRAAAGPLEARAIVGSAREVADGLAAYRERLGLDLLVARTEVPGVDPAACEASLERLAGIVAESGGAPHAADTLSRARRPPRGG
jgi:alkanesulfonate monooxygenase SsuD/methylene tetrahydromethanopterin reductase-like flavin-dependent oxidoreductase (luciferase family)